MRTGQTRMTIAVAAGALMTLLVGCGDQVESVPADDQCEVVERVQDEPIDCPE